MELNLENPIFVYYLNTTGMTTMRIQQYIDKLDQYFSNIKNITMWVVPTERKSKIKCIYDGGTNSNFKKFKKQINDCISKNEDIKPALRKLILDDILEE